MKTFILLIAAPLLLAQTTVRLTVTGIPEGSKPEITVTLPSGKTSLLTDPGSFSATLAGKYRVTGQPFRVAGELIDAVLEAPPQEQTVKEGAAVTLTLSYRQRPGSGMLWVATARIDEDTDDFSKGNVRGFPEAALREGKLAGPQQQIVTGPRLGGGFAAPDGAYYFVDGWDQSALMRLSPQALGSKTGKAVKVAGTEVLGYKLSPAGDLWEKYGNVLRRRSTSSLTAGAAVVELTVSEEEDGLPSGHFLFTAAGDLLLYGGGSVARIAGEKLKGKRTLTKADAAAIVTYSSGSVGHGALDEAGNLWFTTESGAVLQITAAELESGGAIEPRSYDMEQSSSALTIDNAGGVWVLVRYTGAVHYLEPGGAAFVARGSLGKGFDEHTELTLNPPPPWSPLAMGAGFPKRLGEE